MKACTFEVIGTFRLSGRGLVVYGNIVSGTVRNGDLLLIPFSSGRSISVEITSVEFVDSEAGSYAGLLLGSAEELERYLPGGLNFVGETLEIQRPEPSDDPPRGRDILIDPNAESADPALPAFLARPAGAPVYHGFPLIEESRTEDGWCFGSITEFDDPNGVDYGDAFVQAPDGSRAGIVWQVGDGENREILPPEPSRWGVYGFWFPEPIRSREEMVAAFHGILPELRRIHARVKS